MLAIAIVGDLSLWKPPNLRHLGAGVCSAFVTCCHCDCCEKIILTGHAWIVALPATQHRPQPTPRNMIHNTEGFKLPDVVQGSAAEYAQ